MPNSQDYSPVPSPQPTGHGQCWWGGWGAPASGTSTEARLGSETGRPLCPGATSTRSFAGAPLQWPEASATAYPGVERSTSRVGHKQRRSGSVTETRRASQPTWARKRSFAGESRPRRLRGRVSAYSWGVAKSRSAPSGGRYGGSACRTIGGPYPSPGGVRIPASACDTSTSGRLVIRDHEEPS